ncbi:MAG: SUMF1/EgtB/PvdO family nonheme iron enzyme [Planctomycetia bacterium]|nr:SUMF1/EgtB/PvdO family nonheme iron enzyme [Planctomycetia bacterium]
MAGDDLIGRLAVRLRLIAPERWNAAEAAWRAGPPRELGAFLEERGDLSGTAVAALRVLAGEVPDAESSSAATVVSPSGGRAAGTEPLPAAAGKFTLGEELGRGGIGRVVEARDADFGRAVALKLLIESADATALERFRREARLTGFLEHPNIVPVHEMGVLPGTRQWYYCMKRIAGRDMARVIRQARAAAGDAAATKSLRWSLRRLVEAFRDACRAVAYAHSKGVIHRDIKPANIMLGEFGEVLVVDWGLAREVDPRVPVTQVFAAGDDEPSAIFRESSSSPGVTTAGQIIGTPAYMSPEQALGQHAAVGPRSDVWSLGATLYEILTGRAPFAGATPRELARAIVKTAPAAPRSLDATIPADLEAICLKALSRDPGARYADAGEMAGDVEAWLDGAREQERRDALAAEQLARGRDAVARFFRLRGEAETAREQRDRAENKADLFAPLPELRAVWDLQDRAESLERARAEAFAEAEEALASALSNAPEKTEARQQRPRLHWDPFLEAEAAGNSAEMVLHRRIVESHHDRSLAAELSGEGEVSVATRAYACRCLLDGRDVAPAELAVRGLHPWSGRDLHAGRPAPWPGGEVDAPLRLRVHAASCEPAPLEGAAVWAYRFVPIDRVLVPVTPGGAPRLGDPAPAAALDALFPNPTYRPRGPGLYLGRTPVRNARLSMGSWLLVLVADGRAPARVPVHVARQQAQDVAVTLFDPAEIPDGFVHVAAGPFVMQGDATTLAGAPAVRREADDVFVARFPVTCRDWAGFVNAAGEDPPRLPRHVSTGKSYWPALPGGRTAVPTADWIAAHPAEAAALQRMENDPGPWLDDWPVLALSWTDGAAFALRRSRRENRLFHLPHEDQWEKAARGVDRRVYPWGDTFEGLFANVQGSFQGIPHPAPVDSFPYDESPYGVRGLGGNVSDRCLNDPGHDKWPDWRVIKGGSWQKVEMYARAMYRAGSPVDSPNLGNGHRLACAVRLSPAAATAASFRGEAISR